jgi:AMIN domain
MGPTSRAWFFTLAVCVVIGGCAKRAPLTEPPTHDPFAELSAPLDLVEFRVVKADGHRGLFLKLSRLPDSVTHHTEKNPSRIVLDIAGPTGTESPDEAFPGDDSLVSRLHVSRTFGVLRVAIDLQSVEVPEYSVHPMADYIMIRLDPPKS